MNGSIAPLAGLLAVTAAASLDGLSAALAYSAAGIRLPNGSLAVIGGVCGVATGLACALGQQLGQGGGALAAAGPVLLMAMGLFKLAEGSVKQLVRRAAARGEFHFSALNARFILAVYADPVRADADRSGHLAPGEALVLALALSADGVLGGMGYGLSGLPVWQAVLWAVAVNCLLLAAGRAVGQRLAGRLRFPDWLLGGLMLTAVALARLI